MNRSPEYRKSPRRHPAGRGANEKTGREQAMTKKPWLSACATTALVLGFTMGDARAAGDNCIKVLGCGSSGEKESMDPSSMYAGDDAYHIFAAYNRLLDLDDNFKAVPEMATSYEGFADGKSWTFHLRKGVKFHDGSDFDAADVVYTFKRMLDPQLATGAKQVLTFLDADGITAFDPLAVPFKTQGQ